MEWQPWKTDNLPEAKRHVLIWYKSGFRGSREFFFDENDRISYRKGMEWTEKNPEGYESKIEWLMIAQEMSKSDPITHWMYFPDGPKE